MIDVTGARTGGLGAAANTSYGLGVIISSDAGGSMCFSSMKSKSHHTSFLHFPMKRLFFDSSSLSLIISDCSVLIRAGIQRFRTYFILAQTTVNGNMFCSWSCFAEVSKFKKVNFSCSYFRGRERTLQAHMVLIYDCVHT